MIALTMQRNLKFQMQDFKRKKIEEKSCSQQDGCRIALGISRNGEPKENFSNILQYTLLVQSYDQDCGRHKQSERKQSVP